jgi:hypothetical protein
MQYDPRIVSPGRFMDYLSQVHHAAQYVLEPTIDADALRRFQRQPLRKAKVRLARPQQLAAVEPDMEAASAAFQMLGNAYQAPVVTLTLSMERNEGELAAGAKDMVAGFLRMAGQGNSDIRGITVMPEAGEGTDNEEINLLDSLLSLKADLPLPHNDPDGSYAMRADHLARALEAVR